MNIKKINLVSYRNYDKLELNFNNHLNIIIGDNAQGKTNILESIYVLALTKSFQKINDKNLIMFNKEFLKINGEIEIDNSNKKLQIIITEKDKKLKVNNNEVKKFYNYISKMNVILFTPDDIKIFKDSPSSRRRLLNIELSQINNRYIKNSNQYNLLLKQRNEYLKSININLEYLDIINSKFVELAVDICFDRINFINLINSRINHIFKDITDLDGLAIKYSTNIDINNNKEDIRKNMLDKINSNLEKEKLYGISLYGPHRDDFSFYLSDKDLALYGSQGQLRTAILSFKLAEIEIFKSLTKEYPILLLDDVFSELDHTKKNNVIKYISDNIQTIITTTDVDMINKKIVDNAKIITINNGRIMKQEGKE